MRLLPGASTALIGILLSACVSWDARVPSHTSGQTGDVWLVFTSQRQLVMDPVGCSMFPGGGAARERELVRRLRENDKISPFLLSAGTAFLPLNMGDGAPSPGPEAPGKLVEEWNGIGLRALSPGASDLKLGIAALKALQAKARFPFLVSNLVDESGRPIFTPYLETNVEGREILVLGVMDPDGGTYSSVGARITDPLASVGKLVAERGKGRLVIVLSSLNGNRESALIETVKGVHVVLSSGDGPGGFSTNELVKAPVVFGRPDFGGRQAFVARIDPGAGFGEAFDLDVAERVNRTMTLWRNDLEEARERLARAKGAEKRSLLKSIAELKGFMGRYSEDERVPAPRALTYRRSYVFLDASFEPAMREGKLHSAE